MLRIFLPAVIALASLLPSVGLADTEKTTLFGCRGVYEGRTGRVYCEGVCTHKCAEVIRNANPGMSYPDQLTTFEYSVPTFQSECLFLGTNQDGTEAYVLLP